MRLLTGYAKPIIALAVTPDGSRLFSAAQGQTMIWQWDLASGKVTGKLRCNFSTRGVHALAISPRGDFLVSASEASGVGYWPLDGSEPRQLDAERVRHEFTSFNPGLAVHPTQQLVAASYWRSGTGSGCQTWDLTDDNRRTVRTGHESYVDSIAFSSDGALVATASQDGTVRLWTLSGEGLHVMRPRVGPTRVVFRPDGKALAVSGMRSVFVFERTGELIEELKAHNGNVKGLAYSPDGKYLASAGLDGVVILRDAQTRAVVGQRHLDLGKLTSMIWLADSSGLIVGGEKLIAVCELSELLVKETNPKKRGEPLSLAGHKVGVVGLSYSRDGRTLASWGGWNGWHFWDLSGGAGQAKDCTPQPPPRFGNPRVASWSPDSARLALPSTARGCLGEVGSGAVVPVPTAPRFWLRHLAFTPSGRLFLNLTASGRPGAFWTRFELRDARGEETCHAKQIDLPNGDVEVSHSAFSPDERHVYAAFPKNGVYRWSPLDGEVVQLFAQSSQITDFAVRDDERLALTAGGNTAHVWSLPELKKLAELKHPLTCTGVAFLPGERIITACYDGVVRIWDATGGAELHAFELGMGKIYSLAVSPDHMTFAAGVEKKHRIVLMDVPE